MQRILLVLIFLLLPFVLIFLLLFVGSRFGLNFLLKNSFVLLFALLALSREFANGLVRSIWAQSVCLPGYRTRSVAIALDRVLCRVLAYIDARAAASRPAAAESLSLVVARWQHSRLRPSREEVYSVRKLAPRLALVKDRAENRRFVSF